MFKNISTWSQKKLKWIHAGFMALYSGLSFVAPVITVLVMAYSTSEIQEKYKLPVICILVCVIIIIAAAKFFSKNVDGIKIMNLDGTYNRAAQLTKHILQLVSHGIIPIVLLIATLLFRSIFHAWIDFYSTMIIWSLSFFLAGFVVDKLFLSELNEEYEIRDDVAKSNAVEMRKGLH